MRGGGIGGGALLLSRGPSCGGVSDGVGLHSGDSEFEVDHFHFEGVESLFHCQAVVLLHCAN